MTSKCGNKRCHNGWIWWHGSEYPCSDCERKAQEDEKARQQADAFAKQSAEEVDGDIY